MSITLREQYDLAQVDRSKIVNIRSLFKLTSDHLVSYGRCMDTNKNVRIEIATRIENHMAAKGIKRKTVIEALPMGTQAFERRMRGELDFGMTELWIIASVLRASPLQLLPEDAAEVHAVAA